MPIRTIGGTEVVNVCSDISHHQETHLCHVSWTGLLKNVSVIDPWKHLCGDQVVQSVQLNRALEQLSEQLIYFGLGTLISDFVDEQLSPRQGPFLLHLVVISSILVFGKVKVLRLTWRFAY